MNKITKGNYGGRCNRTACSSKNAVWFNQAMASSFHSSCHRNMSNAYYCETCAKNINHFLGSSYRVVGPEEKDHPWYTDKGQSNGISKIN